MRSWSRLEAGRGPVMVIPFGAQHGGMYQWKESEVKAGLGLDW